MTQFIHLLDSVVVEEEVDISRPKLVRLHKDMVARRPLVLVVARQHALQAHADALDIVHGTPALTVQQVEADDAVRVDMRVHGYLWCRGRDSECHFRRFDGIVLAELKLQPVGLVLVQRIIVEDLDVHVPFFEVVGRDERYAWRGVLMQLDQFLLQPPSGSHVRDPVFALLSRRIDIAVI